MKEELLQYIWMAGLFNARDLRTKDGEEISIFNRGKLNSDSGPDFSNAHIRIGNTEWIGTIEIHLKSEQWYQHKHHLDPAFNNVVLHVVFENNGECHREDGTLLYTVELKDRIPPALLLRYELLMNSGKWISCQDHIQYIETLTIEQTINRTLIQRLEQKSKQVNEWLIKSNKDWNTVFYLAIARSFGFGINSQAFENLAMSLPLSILSKHQNDTVQIAALVFGTAGFLDNLYQDDYFIRLKTEWEFLKVKYDIQPLSKNAFKFMRMRPGNFPGMRLAQFSEMAFKCPDLFSQIRDNISYHYLSELFSCEANAYWKTHYHFKNLSSFHHTTLTTNAKDQLIINAVVPVLFVYGKQNGIDSYCEKAIDLLFRIPPENNSIIRMWKDIGIPVHHAGDSQALLELKKTNCEQKKCLNCPIGNKILGH